MENAAVGSYAMFNRDYLEKGFLEAIIVFRLSLQFSDVYQAFMLHPTRFDEVDFSMAGSILEGPTVMLLGHRRLNGDLDVREMSPEDVGDEFTKDLGEIPMSVIFNL